MTKTRMQKEGKGFHVFWLSLVSSIVKRGEA